MSESSRQRQNVGWGPDLRAGIVVCLVALPLCLGIALASGAPLVSGLITGVIGGLLVSWLGGTSLLVSGPAAGLAAIVLAAITELGSFEAFLAASAVAGLMQLGLGLARAGRLAALVPSSVVTGMLAAIGVLLILQQAPHAVGATVERGHGLGLLLVPFEALRHATFGPSVVAGASLALLFAWDHPAAKRLRGVLPGPLVAVIVGTLLAEALAIFAPTLAVPVDRKVSLPDMGPSSLGGLLTMPDWAALTAPSTWRIALTLAIVASLETLLSMEATDRMDPLKRRSDGDRELVAQGVGNTVAGLIGGLPMTGVIVRSAANIAAGGRTWRSAFVHGVVLAAAVVSVPMVLERIPLAALAAVLLHTGWKLAHPSRFAAAFRVGASYGVPLAVTVLAVVATDLLIGVAVGLAVSVLGAVAQTARAGVQVVRDGRSLRLVLADAVTFVHKPRIREVLDQAPVGALVTVDGSRARTIDHDVLELLHAFDATARDRRIHYELVGVPAPSLATSH